MELKDLGGGVVKVSGLVRANEHQGAILAATVRVCLCSLQVERPFSRQAGFLVGEAHLLSRRRVDPPTLGTVDALVQPDGMHVNVLLRRFCSSQKAHGPCDLALLLWPNDQASVFRAAVGDLLVDF